MFFARMREIMVRPVSPYEAQEMSHENFQGSIKPLNSLNEFFDSHLQGNYLRARAILSTSCVKLTRFMSR